jgi:Glycerophosphoryl diester phosphodiesterase
MIVVILLTVLLLLSYFGYWTGRGMGSFYTSCPMIISHRGVTEKFPENTIEAYKDSVKMGFKEIELDVLASKDKKKNAPITTS